MSEPGQAGRTSARGAALVIAAVALLDVVLVCAVLHPRTFFSGDAGVKYLQALTLAQSGWRRVSIPSAAAGVDPDDRFSAFAGAHFFRRAPRAPVYGVFGDLFTIPVSTMLALFGPRGLYIVPALACIVTMWLAYRLARRSAPRTAWLAPLLVGACSPMLFYSVDLWEHTLAAMFSTAAVLWVVGGTADKKPWMIAFGGLALGTAVGVREELYGLVLGVLLAVALGNGRRRLPAALTMLGAVCVTLVPLSLLKWSHYGSPIRNVTRRLLLRVGGSIVDGDGLPIHSAAWTEAVPLLIPSGVAWLLPLAMAIALRVWLSRATPRWQGPLLIGLAIVVLLWAMGDAWITATTWLHPDALVQAFPAVLFLLFLPPAVSPRPARREIAQLLIIAAVYALVVAAAAPFALIARPLGGTQWGPRFLMPLFPMLAVVIAFAFERRGDWAPRAAYGPHLAAATLAALVLASGIVQAQGIRELRQAKWEYERVAQATEALEAQAVVATDLWWFPTATASVVYAHPTVLLDRFGNGSLPELLALLSQRDIDSLTLVSGDGHLSDTNAAALAETGWIETKRQRVPIWLNVDFVSYRRVN